MAKKVVLIVVGIVVLLCGLGGLAAGIGVTAINGRDLNSGFHPLGTQTPALVSRTERVSNSAPSGSSVGTVDITISARSDVPVFIGIGPATQVNQFLTNVPYDEVTDLRLSPYRVDVVRHDGTQPADPPGGESFWTVSAKGTSPTLTWRVTSGDYRIVIMNVTGAPGMAFQGQFGFKIAGVGGIGIGVLIFGLLLAVVGVVLIVLGIRTRATPATPVGAGPYPPVYPPPPGAGPPYGGPPAYGETPPRYGENEPGYSHPSRYGENEPPRYGQSEPPRYGEGEPPPPPPPEPPPPPSWPPPPPPPGPPPNP